VHYVGELNYTLHFIKAIAVVQTAKSLPENKTSNLETLSDLINAKIDFSYSRVFTLTTALSFFFLFLYENS
jgi:hypothetical protein